MRTYVRYTGNQICFDLLISAGLKVNAFVDGSIPFLHSS